MLAKPSIYLRWKGYYDFTPENIKRYVLKDPPLAGVYKLAELRPYGRLVPFYVGQSKDLFKVLNSFFTKPIGNQCLNRKMQEALCSFKFASLLDEKERKAVFSTLCCHYKPECNNPHDIPHAALVNVNLH